MLGLFDKIKRIIGIVPTLIAGAQALFGAGHESGPDKKQHVLDAVESIIGTIVAIPGKSFDQPRFTLGKDKVIEGFLDILKSIGVV